MYSSLAEMEDLREMRNNVRRGVNALDVCWSCENVCEVSRTILGDGHRVWLCPACEREAVAYRSKAEISN